jgi:hypothetical protein
MEHAKTALFIVDSTVFISMAEQTKTLYFDREANWWSNAIRAFL